MVSTKHCCWGTCNSDSRFSDKLLESLKELLELGMKLFKPFPKPSQGIERCQRWVNACCRDDFTIDKITRNTYICALHWHGQRGPTDEFPDPLKANFTGQEVLKASRPKRKEPQTRGLVNKWAKEGNSDSCLPSTSTEDLSEAERSNLETEDVCTDNELFGWGEDENNKATQTEFTKLSSKIETIIGKNELKAKTSQDCVKIVNKLSYEVVAKDSNHMKHFVGLTTPQFEFLLNNEGKSCDGNTFQPVCGTVTGTSFTVLVLDVRLSAFLSRKILTSSHLPLSIQESRM